MSGIYANGPKGKADRLFSQLVRLTGYCENPECRLMDASRLQCAHIMSRKFNATRVLRLNAVSLCASCHAWFTARPTEWRPFLTGAGLRTDDDLDELYRLTVAPFKVPKGWWEERCVELTAAIAAEKERQECLLNGQ